MYKVKVWAYLATCVGYACSVPAVFNAAVNSGVPNALCFFLATMVLIVLSYSFALLIVNGR